MKFDIVIGNPPYTAPPSEKVIQSKTSISKNLSSSFILMSFDLCQDGIVALIVPGGWMGSKKTEELSNVIKSRGLRLIARVSDEHFPTVAVRSRITYFITDTKHTGPVTIIGPAGKFTVPINSDLAFNNPLDWQIVKKVCPTRSDSIGPNTKLGPFKLLPGAKGSLHKAVKIDSNYSLSRSDTHPTRALAYCGSRKSPQPEYLFTSLPLDQKINKYKVAFPSIGVRSKKNIYELGTTRVVQPGVGVINRSWVNYFDSENEAHNFANYLNSKLITFIIGVTKINDTRNHLSSTADHIPNLSMNQAWTDAELYEHFKLTDDEIAHIENNFS